MGDRANIFIKENNRNNPNLGIWLYTQFGGFGIACVLKKALAYKEKWGSSCHLARIIFQEMIGDSPRDSGFCISSTMIDSERWVLVVDTENQQVHVADHDLTINKSMNFSEFIKLSDKEVHLWHNEEPEFLI